MIPGQLPVKKKLIETFSIFAAIDHKGHFRKMLNRILNLAALLGTTPTLLKKKKKKKKKI